MELVPIFRHHGLESCGGCSWDSIGLIYAFDARFVTFRVRAVIFVIVFILFCKVSFRYIVYVDSKSYVF